MRILVCPDTFGGSIPAVEAATAIAAGWLAGAPADQVTVRALSDGGPGFVSVLHAALGGTLLEVACTDPLGRPARGTVLVDRDTAYVESAQACGLHLLSAGQGNGPADGVGDERAERDPRSTSSFGLGALVLAAVGAGVREVVVGLGGSGTNDGGAGFLAALGAVPVDPVGRPLAPGGAALRDCAALSGAPRLDVELVAATDVDSPLTGLFGASAVFGPQKGATREDVFVLDTALARYAEVLVRDLPGCPPDLATLPGAGAAGGLGAAILACGGRRESGIGLVRRLTGLDQLVAEADLIITGEGSFDDQSLHGKVVAGVAGPARDLGVPCLVFAGRVTVGRRVAFAAGITQTHSLVEHFGSVSQALARPAEGLREMATRAARQWSRA